MLCSNCNALLSKSMKTCYNCDSQVKEGLTHSEIKVLLVEDDEGVAETIKILLDSADLNCSIEYNGRDGWQSFTKDSFDIAIVDFDLPYIQGLTLSRMMKERNGNFPIILCTGYTNLLTSDDIKASGVDSFMAKPLNMELLLYEIQRLTIGAPEKD